MPGADSYVCVWLFLWLEVEINMATRELVQNYSMYVIAEVESNWNWQSVYYTDPITIGIMQCYAYNASRLLRRCKQSDPNWQTFASEAPRIANYLDAHGDDDFWTGVYLTQAEGNAWAKMAESQENHNIQTADWLKESSGYIDTLLNKGMSLDHPKPLIFAMSMYHQSPARCLRVLSGASPYADLYTLYNACLNDSILGRYTNRYTTNYNRLKDWDEQSAPPDFGQNAGLAQGGNPSFNNSASFGLTRVEVKNGQLFAFGRGMANGLLLRETTPGNWIPAFRPSEEGSSATGGYWGGGSGDALAICQLYDSWEKNYNFAYSQGSGRLNLPDSGASDCSGSIWCAYHQAAGVDPGTWTGEMQDKGSLIWSGSGSQVNSDVLALCQPADLFIFFRPGNSTSSHVEMFMGSGFDANMLGGGSAPVPHYKDAINYCRSGWGGGNSRIQIRRYL